MRARFAALAVLSSIAALAPSNAGAADAARCTVDRATGTTIEPRPLLDKGYLTRWNDAANRVAYMQPGEDGYYRVFTMNPDGSDRRSIAAALSQVPTKHQGMPYWHPSGRYLVFAAEKPEWTSPRMFGNPDYEAVPGFGLHDDLWLVTADGTQAWRLTHDPNTPKQGILMPVFSPDGRHLAWSQRQPDKTYQLIVADFVTTPEPHLENRRSFLPGGRAYYEPGSFTSDSASLTYSSDQDTHSFWHSQIYRLDLASGKSTRLTQGTAYSEHPTVVKTPSGDWVIFMTIQGVDHFPGHLMLGTDWYAMRIDGSGSKRLTSMNVNRRDNPQNLGQPMGAPGAGGLRIGGDGLSSIPTAVPLTRREHALPDGGIGNEETHLSSRWNDGDPHGYDGRGSDDFRRHAQLLPAAGHSGSGLCIALVGE